MAAALKMSTSENTQAGAAGTNEEKDQKKKE